MTRGRGAQDAVLPLPMVWIEGPLESHTEELIRRFERDPKPMYYKPDFLLPLWQAWLDETGRNPPETADPDAFRPPRLSPCHGPPADRRSIARWRENWGVTVTAAAVETGARTRSDAPLPMVAAALGRAPTRA